MTVKNLGKVKGEDAIINGYNSITLTASDGIELEQDGSNINIKGTGVTSDITDGILESANQYTDTKITEVIGGAPETLDTLKELADAIQTNKDEIGNIVGDVTKESLGLGNVENKSSETIRSEITKKNVTDALGYTPPQQDTVYSHPANHPATMITEDATHRFATDVEKNTWNNKANSSHTHDASNITSGILAAARGGTGVSSLDELKTLLGINDNYKILYGSWGPTSSASNDGYQIVFSTPFNTIPVLLVTGYISQYNSYVQYPIAPHQATTTGFDISARGHEYDGINWIAIGT